MSCHSGYTLVELLLAVLVFSLGSMAVVAMQFGAVQATRSSSEAAAALILTEDLVQRLLANTDVIDRYGQALGGAMAPAPGVATGCLDGHPCDVPLWTEQSIASWLALTEQRGLALPQGCVSQDAHMLRVGLSWVSRSAAPPAAADSCMSGLGGDDRRAVTLTALLTVTP